MKEHLPSWLHDWLDVIVPGLHVLLILLLARLVQLLGRRLIRRAVERYDLPPELAMGLRRAFGTLLLVAVTLLILERLGVSAGVLWAAFTGFATVAAVAFFAAWSVLSNIFCTFLIFITRPFRLYEMVELLEDGEKTGLKGKVVDINLLYTTLQEADAGTGEAPTSLQVPNSWFFLRGIRRWRGSPRVLGS